MTTSSQINSKSKQIKSKQSKSKQSKSKQSKSKQTKSKQSKSKQTKSKHLINKVKGGGNCKGEEIGLFTVIKDANIYFGHNSEKKIYYDKNNNTLILYDEKCNKKDTIKIASYSIISKKEEKPFTIGIRKNEKGKKYITTFTTENVIHYDNLNQKLNPTSESKA